MPKSAAGRSCSLARSRKLSTSAAQQAVTRRNLLPQVCPPGPGAALAPASAPTPVNHSRTVGGGCVRTAPVSGEVSLLVNQSSTIERSNEWPSLVLTGSDMSSSVTGSKKLGGQPADAIMIAFRIRAEFPSSRIPLFLLQGDKNIHDTCDSKAKAVALLLAVAATVTAAVSGFGIWPIGLLESEFPETNCRSILYISP